MKFLGRENIYSDYDNSKAVVVPVPYEKTTSYGKGTIKGPHAILKASGYVEHYDIEEDMLISKIGISTLPAIKDINSPQRLYTEIKKVTCQILRDKKIPVYLGGEHTITAAIVSAFKTVHSSSFSILHIDAHSDIRDVYDGTKYSHACVMRRVYEMGIKIVSVGVRSQSYEEHEFIASVGANGRSPLHIFYAHEIHNDKRWVEKVIDKLGKNIYITFDVDAVDPAYIRATGTPEPGGIFWCDIVKFFQTLAKSNKTLIGMDIVELAPNRYDKISDFICAKLICKILGLLIK